MHILVFPGASKFRVIARQTKCVCFSWTPYFFTVMRRWEKGRKCNWDSRPRKYIKALEGSHYVHWNAKQYLQFTTKSSPILAAKSRFLGRSKKNLDAEAYGWSHSRISDFYWVTLILKISTSSPSMFLSLQYYQREQALAEDSETQGRRS